MKGENELYACSNYKKETIFNDVITFEFENKKFAFCSKKCLKEWIKKIYLNKKLVCIFNIIINHANQYCNVLSARELKANFY